LFRCCNSASADFALWKLDAEAVLVTGDCVSGCTAEKLTTACLYAL